MSAKAVHRRLSVKEAMQEYPVSRSHPYNLITAGKIRDAKIGGRQFILAEDLEKLLVGRTEQ